MTVIEIAVELGIESPEKVFLCLRCAEFTKGFLRATVE